MNLRKILMVVLFLGISYLLSAQETKYINTSYYDSLITELENRNYGKIVRGVDISSMELFLKYCKRKGIHTDIQDTLCYYIGNYYAYHGYDLSFDNHTDIHIWTTALKFVEKHLGKTDIHYWHLLNHQAKIFAQNDNFKRVDSCYSIILKYQKKTLGSTHPDCITTMQELSWINYLISEQETNFNKQLKAQSKASKYAIDALSAAINQYGRYSIEWTKVSQYAEILSYVMRGWIPCFQSDWDHLHQLYQCYHKSSLINTEHYYELLVYLTSIHLELYNYSEAFHYIQEMTNIALENQCKQQLFLSNYYWGYYYQQQGNFKLAEEYYDKCIAHHEYIPRTPIIYANPPEYTIARFYHDIGDYAKSDSCAQKLLKKAHYAIDYANMYMITAENAMARQELDNAVEYFNKSYDRFSYINNSKAASRNWHKFAQLLYQLGLYKNAWDFAFKAYSELIGHKRSQYIHSTIEYYDIFIDCLYYGKCLGIEPIQDIEWLFGNAKSVYQKSYGTNHNKYAELLYHYANWTQNVDSAALAIQKYVDIYHKNFVTTTSFLSEKQRERYWNTILPKLENTPLLMWSLLETHPEMLDVMYNNELFCKGALLKATNQIAQSIISSGDSVLITDWERLTWLHENLEYQRNQAVSNAIYNMQQEAEQLEKKIVAKSSEYRQDQKQWAINVDSVKKHLPSDALAIEFLIIPEADKKWHCALLLRNNYKHPEVIVLFEEKEVSSFLSTSNGNITNQTYDYYSNGDTISKLVWSKILPYINEGETIYFAPSGLLHQLVIEYLPYDENRTMSDVYNMVRLSSTREIVLNKQNTEYTTATIYGGIAYDLEEDILLAESENYAKENLLASRSIENDTLNRGNVKYLPGTKKEAESINTLLKQNNISAKLYTTAKANEESFKALSGKHSNILHIGTHGFTWTDSVAKKQDFFTQRVQLMGQEQYHDTSIDPLNRCGLLFAGANIALQGNSKNLPEGVQDGILTAKEISLLDLRDANLVVLSACETAKGDITSEGVFGLQRAFKMAGVQTIIMSLWKVNDQATQFLMTEFYNNWIGKHQSKRDAFRNAQNTVRTQYEEPEYWAGFIMLD